MTVPYPHDLTQQVHIYKSIIPFNLLNQCQFL